MIDFNPEAEAVKYQDHFSHRSGMCNISGRLMKSTSTKFKSFSVGLWSSSAMRNGQLHAEMSFICTLKL